MKHLKTILLSLLISGLLFVITFAFVVVSKNFHYPPKLFLNTLAMAKRQSHDLPSHINIIFLGLDRRDDSIEKNQDTDTIIFVNIDTVTLSAKLIPLPRDIWYQNASTRINKIYQQSLNRPNSIEHIKNSFEDIVGQTINHVVILDTQILIPIIQTIGPVDVYLDYQLIDDRYPDPNHIANPQQHPDPYMTIGFSQGKNTIDTDNVLFFIRSRKGSDLAHTGGTDTGRARRQQLLIEAIINKFKQEKIYLNLKKINSLYHIWSRQITKDINDQTILAILFKNKLNFSDLSMQSISLPIGSSATDHQAVIYHPDNFINGAWVYLPTRQNYSFIHLFIDQQLN